MQYKDDVKVSTQEYLKTYYTFNVGDIAFEGHHSKEFKFGRFVENDIGDGIVSHIFVVFRPICNYDIYFWKYAINNERIMQKILSRSTKASTMMHDLVTNDFLNESIFVPCIEEQRVIGIYLRNIEKLITLHKQKLEQQKKLKRYFLQNMFPTKGEKVPKIRLKGFNGDWKKCKLSNISTLNGRIGFRGYTQKDIITKEEGGILTFSPTNIIDSQLTSGENKNTYITKQKYDESPEIKINNGDILFVKTGSTLGKSCLVTNLLEPASINPQIVVIRTNPLFRRFLAVQFTSDLIQEQIASVKVGGAIPTMTEAQIKAFNIILPSDITEAEAIGNIFMDIDNVMDFYKKRVDELHLLKKYMLQNMFI